MPDVRPLRRRPTRSSVRHQRAGRKQECDHNADAHPSASSDERCDERLHGGRVEPREVAHEPEITRHVDRVALLSDETMSSDEALAAYVRATVTTQFHPCGTARMGPVDDATAVVDQRSPPLAAASRRPPPCEGGGRSSPGSCLRAYFFVQSGHRHWSQPQPQPVHAWRIMAT